MQHEFILNFNNEVMNTVNIYENNKTIKSNNKKSQVDKCTIFAHASVNEYAQKYAREGRLIFGIT